MLASAKGQNTVVICPFDKAWEYQRTLSEIPDGEAIQAAGRIKIVAPFENEQARVDRMETKYKDLGFTVVFDESFPLPTVSK